MPELSLDPMQRTLARLREGVDAFHREPENTIYLDSLIKRFELAYEMSRNTMARFVEATSMQLKSDDGVTLSAIVRTANQDGLLRATWEQWKGFRDARNQTSHAYDESKARAIAESVPAFLAEAEFLYEQMLARLGEV